MNYRNLLKISSWRRKAQKIASTVNDPLLLLREDTYSNEETNEMAGRMIRGQFKKSQQ